MLSAYIEYENKKQNTQLIITQRNDITALLGKDWRKKLTLTIRSIQLDENNQLEKIRVIEKLPHLFKNTETIKETVINIQLEQGHYTYLH